MLGLAWEIANVARKIFSLTFDNQKIIGTVMGTICYDLVGMKMSLSLIMGLNALKF